ncbi:MAG: hypothetical protein ACJ76N_28505 [Thermoanaerobaculia bacterium]
MAFLLYFAEAATTPDAPPFPWGFLGLVVLAGALGGLVNALISDNGFLFPKNDTTSTGQKILRPGVLGNIIIGLTAALVFWLLNTDADTLGATLTLTTKTAKSFGGAILAGVGGARLLTSEVDKRLFQAAAAEAIAAKAEPAAANKIRAASPAQALEMTKNLPKGEP